MRFRESVSILSIFIFLATVSFCCGNEPLKDLARKRAIETINRTLHTGNVDFDIQIKTGETSIEAKISCAFDHQKLWIKRTYRSKTGENAEFPEWHGPELIAMDGGETILSRTLSYKDSSFRQLREDPNVDTGLRLFWPQYLGTSIEGVWAMPEKSPRGFLERADYRAIKTSEAVFDSEPSTVVEYESPALPNMNVWYLEKRGGMIGRMIIEDYIGESKFSNEMNSSVREWEPGIWYPDQITTTRVLDGRELFNERIVVNNFSTQKPDSEIFGTRGINLELGDVLVDDVEGNYYKFTTFGLEPMTQSEISNRYYPPETPTKLSNRTPASLLFILLFVFFNLSAIVVYFSWNRWIRKKK